MTGSEASDGFEVVREGLLTTFQDQGRAGFAHLGVPRSGVLDEAAYAAANRAVGNAANVTVLETTINGCAIRALTRTRLAVSGAECDVFVGSIPAPMNRAVHIEAGQVVEIGPARSGVRSYVAVAGGFAPEPVLGSRSTCTLSELGPSPIRDGDRLPVMPTVSSVSTTDAAETDQVTRSGDVPSVVTDDAVVTLRIVPGPRDDWFVDGSLADLTDAEYVVTQHSNRVGLRLDGPELRWREQRELPSEGMVLGAVQVPPSGLPIVFLRDHPTTGGYPVIGVLTSESVRKAAQARPGQVVRFALVVALT